MVGSFGKHIGAKVLPGYCSCARPCNQLAIHSQICEIYDYGGLVLVHSAGLRGWCWLRRFQMRNTAPSGMMAEKDRVIKSTPADHAQKLPVPGKPTGALSKGRSSQPKHIKTKCQGCPKAALFGLREDGSPRWCESCAKARAEEANAISMV